MTENVRLYVKSIAYLLRRNGEITLADHMEQLSLTADENPNEFIDNIKRLYGGMGTLSDIVFSERGRPLIEENNKLETLRRDLYATCSAYKYKS